MRQRNHPTAASALEEVRWIALGVLGKQPVSVYLFGSWARGDATPQSDIDLAIEAHSPLPPGMLALLRERLEESHVPYHMEVVELSGVDPEFWRLSTRTTKWWRGGSMGNLRRYADLLGPGSTPWQTGSRRCESPNAVPRRQKQC